MGSLQLQTDKQTTITSWLGGLGLIMLDTILNVHSICYIEVILWDRFTIWKTNSMAMKRLASPVTRTRALIAKAMEAAAMDVRHMTSAK